MHMFRWRPEGTCSAPSLPWQLRLGDAAATHSQIWAIQPIASHLYHRSVSTWRRHGHESSFTKSNKAACHAEAAPHTSKLLIALSTINVMRKL